MNQSIVVKYILNQGVIAVSNADLCNIFDYLICNKILRTISRYQAKDIIKQAMLLDSGMSLVIVFLIRYINTDRYRVYNITVILVKQNN